jgi:hypothetical protein
MGIPRFPDDFEAVPRPGVDGNRPGIYLWTIHEIGTYVGKYTHRSRWSYEYSKNVNRMIDNSNYRPGRPDGWRTIHRALYLAHRTQRRIQLELVENCSPGTLFDRERVWIADHGVLNGVRGRFHFRNKLSELGEVDWIRRPAPTA